MSLPMLFCNIDLKVSWKIPIIIAVVATITRTKDPGHVVFNDDKDDNDDILTIILRSTFLTDWAGSWMPSRTHGLSCRLRFI